MRKILMKEIQLSASPITYFFLLFGLMFFLPGYPVLCGAFFVTLGIYQGFQKAREANDMVFSVLLPIAKRDVVKGKYLFVCMIELWSALLMLAAVILRMTVFADSIVYRNNALMNANFFALGMAFVIFALFNLVFMGGFFKTAYKIGKPFIIYIITAFLMIGIAEVLHHIPSLAVLNSFGTAHLDVLLISFLICIVLFAAVTWVSYLASCKRFEQIDL